MNRWIVKVVVLCFLFCAASDLQAADSASLFAVPDFNTLPTAIKILSEQEVDGVKVTELSFAGAPFNGKPSRIYGFYARPAKPGRYPAVLQLHGAGMGVFENIGPVQYAKNGFACLGIDWCGPAQYRKQPRKPPYSEFESPGSLAVNTADPNLPWKAFDPCEDTITNGVRFARRSFMFLKSQPEVDPDKLFLSGMSAGAHLSLLILGQEPAIKAAAVKYGCGFIRDLPGCFGGYFGPLVLSPKPQQDAWFAVLDPKHYISNYKSNVLLTSGTDDIFFWMPLVLETYRAIPTPKCLVMYPNDNHSHVNDEILPIRYFRSVLGTQPEFPTICSVQALAQDSNTLVLTAAIKNATPITKLDFCIKQLTSGEFQWSKNWVVQPAKQQGSNWTLTIPKTNDRVIFYAFAEDATGAKVSSDVVIIPDDARWYLAKPASSVDSNSKSVLEKKAADFDRALTASPEMSDRVKIAGNLCGKVEESDAPAIGWFEYDFNIATSGFYELLAKPACDNIEFFVDKDLYLYGRSGSEKVANIWLETGKHTVRLQRYHWTGFSLVNAIVLNPSQSNLLSQNIRIDCRNQSTMLRKGAKLEFSVWTANLSSPQILNVWLKDQAGKIAITESKIELPVSAALKETRFSVTCTSAGIFAVVFGYSGKEFALRDIPPLTVTVIDTTPQQPGGQLVKKLIKEIDCVAADPEYFSGGPTRIIKKSFGSYRESSDKGWLQFHNSTDPGWFVYKIAVPVAQQPYIIEYDYPDDALRTFVVAIRESDPLMYPPAVGADCGGEFTLSNSMLTQSILCWPRSTDLRFLAITPTTGRRAAISKIRVYSVDPNLPLPDVKSGDNRVFANWYEEGMSFLSMYGAPNESLSGIVTGADRWAHSVAYMGGNMLMPTVSIYSMSLYPSKYNLNICNIASPDIVRLLLLSCEKYGMYFVGEFHPGARELSFITETSTGTDPNRGFIRSRDGNFGHAPMGGGFTPCFSPLFSENQKWYLDMIGEFVDRYKDSPVFKGVSLRIMTWANPSFNNFASLDWGYEDCTIDLFQKETRTKIPVDVNDSKRFQKRYDWLMVNAKDKWIAWRCEKVAQIYTTIRDRVRQARPDLVVYTDLFGDPSVTSSQALREAGLDVSLLGKIDGVCIINALHGYGRSSRDERAEQEMRDYLLDTKWLSLVSNPLNSAFLYFQRYFEATEVVAIPEDMGFPAKTKRTWTSGDVNPAGWHCLERWALAVAQTDATFLSDGGNGYTLGQPELRDFLIEYRSLPKDRFTPRKDATDPVAVWELKRNTDNIFYAVNRESYPITIDCCFNQAGLISSLSTSRELANGKNLRLRLEPYQLITCRTPANMTIDHVETIIPPEQIEKSKAQIAWINDLAAYVQSKKHDTMVKPSQIEYLTGVAKEASDCFKQHHLWRARTILENHLMLDIYKTVNRYPPMLRDNGTPKPPSESLKAADLFKHLSDPNKASLVPGQKICPDWFDEPVVLTAGNSLSLAFDIPVDGCYALTIGHADGSGYSPLDAVINGKKFSVKPRSGKSVCAAVSTLSERLPLSKGRQTICLQTSSRGDIALNSMLLSPVYRDIVANEWMVIGPFPVDVKGQADSTDIIKKAMRSTVWPAEVKHDFKIPVLLEDGTQLYWQTISSDSDFVNFGLITSRKLGSIFYAVTHIYAAVPCTVRLSYGSDYWIKLWANGSLVQDCISPNGLPAKGTFTSDIVLRQGSNELMVKLASGFGNNGFWLAVTDPGILKVSASVVE